MRRSDGFTLIELLVTILIIGILAAIGLAIYSGQRNRAHEGASINALRAGLVAAKSWHVEHGSYIGIDTTASLQTEEATLTVLSGSLASYSPGPSANPRALFLWPCGPNPPYSYAGACVDTTGEYVAMCSASKGDTSFCVRLFEDGRRHYGKAKGNMSAALAATNASGKW